MLDERGREVGQHVGLSFYTLGQRQGLGIGGVKAGGGEHAPWYVARKDLERNVLRVVQGHDHPWLLSHALTADDCSWIAGTPPAAGNAGRQDALPPGRRRLPLPGPPRRLCAAVRPAAMGGDARASRPCCTTARSAWAAASSARQLRRLKLDP
jgi:hypothetical protein